MCSFQPSASLGLTKIDTFEHAVEGGPAPREGAQKGKGAPRLAAPPPVQPCAERERAKQRRIEEGVGGAIHIIYRVFK